MSEKHIYEKYLDTDKSSIDLTDLYNHLKSIPKDSNQVVRVKFDKIYIYAGNSFRRTSFIVSTTDRILVYCPLKPSLKRVFENTTEAKLNNWEDYFV